MKTVLIVEGVERAEDLSSIAQMITNAGYKVTAAEPLNEGTGTCEHDDPKCPKCKGVCTDPAKHTVLGKEMCTACAGIALERA